MGPENRTGGRVGRPPDLDGADDDFGRNRQTQSIRVENQVEVVWVIRIGSMHGPIELSATPVEVPGGAPGGAQRDAHPLGHPLRSDLQGRDDPD